MFEKPKIVFWPVGTGDSTSIVVQDKVVLQVDFRDLAKAADDDDDHASMVDTLVEHLPTIDGKPYLSAFAITHPDEDHILGFSDLLEKVTIGEIWFTPRVFLESDSDLCDDAQVFKDEAKRRVQETVNSNGEVDSGDRVRIIGYDSLLKEKEFEGFPADRLTVPGNSITEVDGTDYEGLFNAFIHAPFAEENEEDRNNTSLAMQVVLGDDPSKGGVLLFGDIAYPRIRRIFDETKDAGNEEFLSWKLFLAPHHCSKSAMYHRDDDGNETLKQDILDDLANFQVDDGFIIASSEAIPSQNKKGDNPPHAKAKQRYEEVAEGDFLCTHEDGGSGEPIVFEANDGQFISLDEDIKSSSPTDKIALAVEDARGMDEPPTEKVGFGE